MRVAAVVGCVVVLSGRVAGPASAAGPATTAADLSPAEVADCKAVVDAMVKAGFPDGAGAVVFVGPVSVTVTYDPAQVSPPLPTDASTMQETGGGHGGNETTYGYQFDGLHLRLADGSWVLGMRYHLRPRKSDRVDTTGATVVKPESATADAIAAHPFDAAHDAAGYLAKVPAADRPRATAVLDRYGPASRYLRIGPDDMAPAAVLLARAGWPDAAGLSLAVAQQRSRSYWQLRPWTAADFPFDPSGDYPTSKDEERQWAAKHAGAAAEPPAVALRRALFRWCRADITVAAPEDAMLPADVAAAACRAAVDPGDPQHNLPRVDALMAGVKLPVNVAETAPLADRLASWEARPRMPRMTVTSGNGGASIGTSFSSPRAAYVPATGDLDALVALLADGRPSRFNDFSGPRTVGDNAWRATAELLKADPRKLAGYPTDRPWTDAERGKAAAAVQAWWKQHGKEHGGK